VSYLLGGVLAAGILLALSPWVWPRGVERVHERPPSPVERLLAGAGYPHITVRTLLLVSGAGAAGLASAAWLATGLPVVATLAGALGASLPFLWLRSRRAHLIRARRGLWPDVCDLLIASVRSGMSLSEAVSSLALSAPAALRPAFAIFASDLAASGRLDSSLDRLKAGLADPVADRIVEALRMTRQVGGTELVPVLRALAGSVRADAVVRAEVEARQSWIRGAAVLGVVAPWVVLTLLALRPEGARAYGSPEGVALVVAGAVVSVVAYRLMIRVGRLPEPRRWFG
jgi:tight adherence protein B